MTNGFERMVTELKDRLPMLFVEDVQVEGSSCKFRIRDAEGVFGLDCDFTGNYGLLCLVQSSVWYYTQSCDPKIIARLIERAYWNVVLRSL